MYVSTRRGLEALQKRKTLLHGNNQSNRNIMGTRQREYGNEAEAYENEAEVHGNETEAI